MNTYDIPTKRDIEQLNARLERIEQLIINTTKAGKNRNRSSGKGDLSATEIVLEIIRRKKDGIGFYEIQMQTGMADKKLRNIIFRLNKLKKIRRKSRGIYILS
ncbi:MAG: hypothetical protein GY874_10450 [Desulfobacteraceae bacterium]|nr:hypothetical protein [Desulfobacteraceae bacterium]